MCVDEIFADYSGEGQNHNGPELVTKIFKRICGVDTVSTTALTAVGMKGSQRRQVW
jgi:hypothetical protein